MNILRTWRWSRLLIVLTMVVGMAGAPVSAQPASVQMKEAAVAASAQHPPPPQAAKPQPPSSPPEKVATASDPALAKLAPELRPLAKARSVEPVIVTVLMQAGTKVQPYFQQAVTRKPIGGLQWATGEVRGANLLKLAGLPGVISIVSFQSYAPVPVPSEKDLRGGAGYRPSPLKLELGEGVQIKEALRQLTAGMTPDQAQEKLRTDTSFRARINEVFRRSLPERPALPEKPSLSPQGGIQPATIKVKDVHGASVAWTKGYTGTGVVAAVVDTGVDFAHPDLQGAQARVPAGPYAGWPYAYDTLSGFLYAFDSTFTIGPDTYWDLGQWTWYAHTLPVVGAICNGSTCTASLKIDFGSDAGWPWPPVVLPFVWQDTSQSGQYYYTVHPDVMHFLAGLYLGLGYAATHEAPAAVIVADENTAGVYDTVYVDVDFDQDLTVEKPMHQGNELAGADLYDATGNPGTDGVWDLSAGMLAWIADGRNVPPGTGVLFEGVTTPRAGRLLAFIGDDDGHGTNCAGDIAAQGAITDPELVGPINPIFGGGANFGGAGGPVLSGMAPGARVAAFQRGFWLPFDSWVLAALGFDGIPSSGDEAQLSSNSWGASTTINDGWDATSRFAHWLNRNFAPNQAILVATGNGGHGYGTVTEPTGGSIIDVGASTQYGTLRYFEPITDTAMLTYGDVQPWSNRGPTTLGDVSPDVVAVGAWGTGANPLNVYGALFAYYYDFWTGQAAYDIFGGTSMATPIAAGNLALVYQAFKGAHGRWPTWQEAKTILLGGAKDLGYDILVQGSGNVDADRSTDIAAGQTWWAEPVQWVAGSYRGTDYPAFPAILHPGGSDTQTFTVHNPTASAVTVNITDTVLQRATEVTFTLSFPSFDPSSPTVPTWITDITALINAYHPDLVRAQVIFPYSVFNPDYDYVDDNNWQVLFYGWKDLNGDGDLWTDTNDNGRIDDGEIDQSPWEYNRFTYGAPWGTYLEASLGRDSYSRWLDPTQTDGDGIFLGVRRSWGDAAVTLQVRLTFYHKQADWLWLSTSASSLNVPVGGNVPFNATLSAPAGARPGVYEGAIEVSAGTAKTVIPVVVHVAANSPTFAFGAASLDEPIGDTPYDNGHLFGGFDWGWRYDAGDWRLFYYDLPSGAAGPDRALIVDTRWINPAPLPPPLFSEDFEGSFPPAGWTVTQTVDSCGGWESTATTRRPNLTGGTGYAADANSDWCGGGMDTTLLTPPIDLSGVSQAWLMFKSDFYDFENQDHGYVDISTDGGTTWTNLLHYDRADYRGPRTEIINITPYVGSANIIIRFHYVAPGQDWWWQVDEVRIYPMLPSPTDVDTWIYAAAPDFYSASDPAFFGPQSVEQVGGSNDTNLGGSGIFTFDTATGGPREVVAGEIRDGLGFISLHNVLHAGALFGEPIVGQAYQVQVSPVPVVITTTRVVKPLPLQFGDSWVQTFTTSHPITEGIEAIGYGLSQPQAWTNEPLSPSPGSCDWSYSFAVSNGGLIEVSTSSPDIADIDLYLFGPVKAVSTGPTAVERVQVKLPPDGGYDVCVDNWSGTSGHFNLTLRVIQGVTDLVVSGLPRGAISANTPITFTVAFTKTTVPGTTWEGVLFLGPAAAPTALEVPVTVNVITPTVSLAATKTASAVWASASDVFTYTITVSNLGSDQEYVSVRDPLPARMEFVPGSQTATKGSAFLDLIAREMRWSDWVNGGETVTITFRVRAASGRGWAENTVFVGGAGSGQRVQAMASTFINPSFGLTLEPPSASQTGYPGEVVTYTLRLTNTGDIADTFDITNTGNVWPVVVPPRVTLTATAAADVTVAVAIPASAPVDVSDTVTVTVASRNASAIQAQSVLTTTAIWRQIYLPLVMKNESTFSLSIREQNHAGGSYGK